MKNIKKNKKKFIAIISIISIGIIMVLTIYGKNNYKNNTTFTNLILQADKYMNNENYKKAFDIYDEALSMDYASKKDKKYIENIRAKSSKAKILSKSKNDFDSGIKNLKNKNYISAVYFLKKIPKEDTKNYEEAVKKIKEIMPIYNNKIIKEANKAALSNNFYEAINIIEDGLKYNSDNKELITLKNKYEKQNRDLEIAKAEKKEKIEKEKYKPKKITSADNYNVWSVYLTQGLKAFKINVKDGEEDNVIVKLEDSVIINEIGIGTYANSIKIPYDGWYKLSIECSMSYSWNFE